MRRKLLAVLPCILGALALAGAALAGNGGFGPVDPQSSSADRTADAYWIISLFALGVLLLVTVPLAVFVVRYRNRGGDRDADGPQVHGNTGFELAWTAVPVLILTAIAAVVFYKLPGITDPKAEAAAGAPLVVRVEGRQFYWRYTYPNGAHAVDELTVPQGRLVELRITAPDEDVIHSYWVPALFGKTDAIPGHENTLRFVPRRAGVYEGQCAEFCGIQHAMMKTSVRVVPAAAFDTWLDGQASAERSSSAAYGRQLFEGVCMKCHRLSERYVGPQLGGNPALADAQALAVLVRQGRGQMPAVGRGWSDTEVEALTAYAKTLPQGAANGG